MQYVFEGKGPRISYDSFIHPQAVIIGDVVIKEGCYVGAGAVIRGDFGNIIIEKGSNIQENCVIHVDVDKTAYFGPSSHIGHGAILHGPKLGEHVVVGMGAIIMDNVVIGDGCVVGAGALVTVGQVIPPRKLVIGVPAKAVSNVTEELRRVVDRGTLLYQQLVQRCLDGLKVSVKKNTPGFAT